MNICGRLMKWNSSPTTLPSRIWGLCFQLRRAIITWTGLKHEVRPKGVALRGWPKYHSL